MLTLLMFSSPAEANIVFNGGLVSGQSITAQGGRVYGLHNRTLTITAAGGAPTTCTFDESSSVTGLTLSDILAQLNASGFLARLLPDGRITFPSITGVALTLDKDGTANALLGFDSAADIVGTVYGAPTDTAPRICQIVPAFSGDGFVALVETV
jgi:hypothetical protein